MITTWPGGCAADPLTGHFTQADTLVPEPGKASAFDRYAYSNNNPINYNDPTGHDKDCGRGDPGCKRKVNKEKTEKSNKNRNKDLNAIKNTLDEILWSAFPSAIGIQIGITGQIGIIGEAGRNIEHDLIFNWRSGEVSLFKTEAVQLYAGTPSLLSGNVYVGSTSVYGLSRNSNYEGGAIYSGFTISAEQLKEISYTHEIGATIKSGPSFPPEPYIDDVSRRIILYEQENYSIPPLSISGAPEPINAGVIGGFSGTELIKTWKIPNWPQIR